MNSLPPPPVTKSSAYLTAGALAFVGALIMTKRPYGWNAASVGFVIGMSLGGWLIGAVAVACSKPQNAKRNSAICLAVWIGLSLLAK